MLASQIVWVIGSICLHELAHGWAAIRFGDRTPIETGHMTWNPLVHMGTASLIVFALVGYAWGLMPVNPSRMRGRHAPTLVALAGPAMNLLLATLSCVTLAVWMRYGTPESVGENLARNLRVFFYMGVVLNLVLAALNLMPIPPLDGSRILAGLSRGYRQLISHPNAPLIGLIVFVMGWQLIGPAVSSLAAAAGLETAKAIEGLLP